MNGNGPFDNQMNFFECEHEHFNFNALVFFFALFIRTSLLQFLFLVLVVPDSSTGKHLNECVSESVWCQPHTRTHSKLIRYYFWWWCETRIFKVCFRSKPENAYWTPFKLCAECWIRKKILADVDGNYIDHVFVCGKWLLSLHQWECVHCAYMYNNWWNQCYNVFILTVSACDINNENVQRIT